MTFRRILIAALAVLPVISSCKKEIEPADPVVPFVYGDGPLLSGRVLDQNGDPVPDVRVTDGFTFSRTDNDGRYSFESSCPERVRYVSVCVPNGYEALVRDGKPIFFAAVGEYQGKERKGDIVLNKLAAPISDFSVLMIADVQTKLYQSGTYSENFAYASRDVCDDMFKDLVETAGNVQGPCYGISLGDISNGNGFIYSQYSLGLAAVGIPFYSVIGNHDHITGEADTEDQSTYRFTSTFGPLNYSFDLGSFHFVMLDNCIYKKGSFEYPFYYGLEDEYLQWLKDDLSCVAKDTPVILCMHANLINYDGVASGEKYYKVPEFVEAIQGFEKVYVWMGHAHWGSNVGRYDSSAGLDGIECHVVARTTGILEGNEYVTNDGTPRGYVRLEASGKELKWKFHPIGVETAPFRGPKKPSLVWKTAVPDEEHSQMRVYPRGSYDDNFVYANIYLWDNLWQMPVLKTGGSAITMQKDWAYDLSYRELVRFYRSQGITAARMADYPSRYRVHHFLARVPDNASGMGTVEVTDRFGNTYSAEVSVDPVKYDDGLLHLVFDFRTAPQGCPTTPSSNVTITDKGYQMTLSNGLYGPSVGGDEGYVQISGQNSTLSTPELWGYKLEKVTVHPAGNATALRSAQIVDADGKVVTGGDRLNFYGNCADSWVLEKTQEHTPYYIQSTGADFRIGELRLAYRGIETVGYPGDVDSYVVDGVADVEF